MTDVNVELVPSLTVPKLRFAGSSANRNVGNRLHARGAGKSHALIAASYVERFTR